MSFSYNWVTSAQNVQNLFAFWQWSFCSALWCYLYRSPPDTLLADILFLLASSLIILIKTLLSHTLGFYLVNSDSHKTSKACYGDWKSTSNIKHGWHKKTECWQTIKQKRKITCAHIQLSVPVVRGKLRQDYLEDRSRQSHSRAFCLLQAKFCLTG